MALLAAGRTDPRRLLAGRYVLLRELGSGAFGAVHAGWDEGQRRLVAVKVLTQDDERGRERFRREGAALARLRHPGIVAVHDVGESEAGQPFLVMDLVRGRPLFEVIAAGALEPQAAARIVRDVALAIQHAHEQGVLHRDLKPHSVLVGQDGRPIVVDFGLVRFEGGWEKSLTADGASLGTPAYMPPEQLRGQEVDARSDVYALGATLYHALAGRPPFEGGRAQVALATLKETPAPPSASAAGVPPALDAVCLRCLEKDPARRFLSARALADALGAALPMPAPPQGRETIAPPEERGVPAGQETVPPPAGRDRVANPGQAQAPARLGRARRWPWVLGLALLVGVVGGLLVRGVLIGSHGKAQARAGDAMAATAVAQRARAPLARHARLLRLAPILCPPSAELAAVQSDLATAKAALVGLVPFDAGGHPGPALDALGRERTALTSALAAVEAPTAREGLAAGPAALAEAVRRAHAPGPGDPDRIVALTGSFGRAVQAGAVPADVVGLEVNGRALLDLLDRNRADALAELENLGLMRGDVPEEGVDGGQARVASPGRALPAPLEIRGLPIGCLSSSWAPCDGPSYLERSGPRVPLLRALDHAGRDCDPPASGPLPDGRAWRDLGAVYRASGGLDEPLRQLRVRPDRLERSIVPMDRGARARALDLLVRLGRRWGGNFSGLLQSLEGGGGEGFYYRLGGVRIAADCGFSFHERAEHLRPVPDGAPDALLVAAIAPPDDWARVSAERPVNDLI